MEIHIFHRKYTEEQVIDLLKKNNIMSARQISDEMGCHKKIVESLILITIPRSSAAVGTKRSINF
jgi:hypothetical protein